MKWEKPVIIELSKESKAEGLCVSGSGPGGKPNPCSLGIDATPTCDFGVTVTPAGCSNGSFDF
jgi:hypothetical protein